MATIVASSIHLLRHFTDLVGFTAEIETLRRQIDGEPADMTLRATMVYRRENGEWKVIHRHGDLLGPNGVTW
jgi:ketosteroid isomerase-like protein